MKRERKSNVSQWGTTLRQVGDRRQYDSSSGGRGLTKGATSYSARKTVPIDDVSSVVDGVALVAATGVTVVNWFKAVVKAPPMVAPVEVLQATA